MKKLINSKWLVLMFSVLLILSFSGCSDSGDNASTSSESGDLVISLTDAPGDFANYTVDVQSLTLTKANGAVVDTLPITTRVDFSQYTEMTEFLTAATVPAGVYTSATLTLNYENADIWVENESGENVQVATIVDEDGNSMTVMEVTVQLANANKLLIAPGIPAHLSLDFDLKASNTVSFDEGGIPTVTVEPSLIAEIEPEAVKIYRVRGPLKEVNVNEDYLRVIIRPFFHTLTGKNENFGSLKVTVSDDTVYDINGESYQGQDGLAVMDELTELTAVVAIGELKFQPLRFEASEVRAGSSVAGGNMDVVTGNVISRNGDEVTVKGATLIRSDGSVVFNDKVVVQLGENTVVKKQLSVDTFSIDDISVGQRISIFGTLTDENETQLEMDSTEGFARMLLTTVRGNVVDTDATNLTAQLTMGLQSIDNRNIGLFDFSGTGTSEENDANPDNYEVNTSTLNISGLAAGNPIKARGFIQPYAQAPADFNAHTIINVQNIRAFMKVKWHPPTAEAFTSISSAGLELNLEDASLFHHLGRGRVVVNLKNLAVTPVIMPTADGNGLYSITWRGTVQVHTNFANFTEDLTERLEGGRKVNKLFATGSFDDASATLTSNNMLIKLQ